MTDMTQLDLLVIARVEAKRIEDDAVERRREIDTHIAELLRGKILEGMQTAEAAGFKATVTYGVTRKVNTELLQNKWLELSDAAQAAFKFKGEIVTAELRKLSPDAAAEAAAFYETKPSSPSVKVEPVKVAA